jgi:hypothetical protein
MALTAYAVLRSIPSTAGLLNAALRVGVPITLAAAVYGVAYWLCGGRELQMLLRKSETSDLESDN